GVARPTRFTLVRHTLAKEVERGANPARVQSANGVECFVERFTGNESAREALGEAVVPHEVEDARLIREIQECGTEHQDVGRKRAWTRCTMRTTGKVRSLAQGSSTFQSTRPSSLAGSSK